MENTQNKKILDKLIARKEKESRPSLPANINHGSLSSVVAKLWRWNQKALQVLWTFDMKVATLCSINLFSK